MSCQQRNLIQLHEHDEPKLAAYHPMLHLLLHVVTFDYFNLYQYMHTITSIRFVSVLFLEKQDAAHVRYSLYLESLQGRRCRLGYWQEVAYD